MPHIPQHHGAGRGKRIAGIALAVFAAFMLVGWVQDVDPAGTVLMALLAGGAWLLYRAGARDAEAARRAEIVHRQLPVLELAREDGRLTATEVATRLGWPMETAGEVLRSMDDGYRVTSMPSDEGVMVYEFRELIHDPDRPRTTAAADPAPLPAAQEGRCPSASIQGTSAPGEES